MQALISVTDDLFAASSNGLSWCMQRDGSLSPSSYKAIGPVRLKPYPSGLLNLHDLLQILSLYTVIWDVRASIYKFGGRHTIQPITRYYQHKEGPNYEASCWPGQT